MGGACGCGASSQPTEPEVTTPKIAPEPQKDAPAASAAAPAESPKKEDKPPDPGPKTEGKGGAEDMSREQAATKIQTLYRGHYERRVPRGERKFILAGPPCSGKGTQCEKIAERFGVVHISTGDMIRAEVATGSDLGKQADELMKAGKLVPDEVVIGMVKSRLSQPDCKKNGWLLDGFPRTAAQAEAMEKEQILPKKMVLLKVSDAELVERCIGRRVDPVTNKNYHLKYKPPPEDEEIKERLIQRKDDTEEAIKIRIQTFNDQIDGIRKYFEHVLHTIDGERKPDVIFEDVSRILQAKPWKLIVAGAPASGKGQQCELLVKSLGLVHISTGEVYRSFKHTEMGAKAHEHLDKGEKVPDEIVVSLVADRLQQPDCANKGWLLDGFPRTKAQAQLLLDKGVMPDKLVVVEVEKQFLLDSCIHRRVDPKTGKMYDIKKNPPASEDVMARLQTRPNDTEAEVTKKLDAFNSEIKEITLVYPKKALYINGCEDPGKVFAAVEIALYGADGASNKEIAKRGAVPGSPAAGGTIAIEGKALVSDESLFEKSATVIQAKFRGHQERKVPRATRKFIIAGPPAAGKGTQCARLVARYGIVHISTGDMLRAEVAKESELGKLANDCMSKGELVPDDLIIKIVKERLAENDCKKNGWLLDGFPRTAAQAAALEAADIKPTKFIKLNVPTEVLVERGVHRRLDPETGKIYHLLYNKPPPEIEGRLTQRKDDNEETILERIKTYESQVNAITDTYRDVLVNLDGARRPEMIFEDVRRVIEECPWRLVINGPAGGGKGAQVARIVEKLGCVHITSGMLITKAMAAGSDLGKEAKELKDAGKPFTDELQMKLIVEALSAPDVLSKGWVLDGFPRSEEQLNEMNNAMIVPDRIILVDVPEEALVAHLTSRRFDPETHKSYFLDSATDPPPDDVKERLQQRDSDKDEAVRANLAPYYKTKAAIMGNNSKKSCNIDGEGTFPSESGNANGKTADEVWDGLCAALYSTSLKAEKRKKKTEAEQSRKLSKNAGGEPWKLFITGPPASGKGALCEHLVAEYGVVHLSTGGIYHAAMKKKLPAAAKAKEAIMSGVHPIPDDIMVEMISGLVVDGTEAQHGWLLDGFPRTKEQAEKLKAAGITPDKYLVVDVPDADLIEFCTKRVLDPTTNTLYHLTTNPPPEDVASRCVQRSDDSEEVVKERLAQYSSDTTGATSVYESLVAKVPGSTGSTEQAEEKALAEVAKVLSS